MKALRRIFYRLALLVVVIAIALTIAGALYSPEPGRLPSAADRQAEIEGKAIRYRQEGAGRDVLLIHGSPGSAEDWEPIWDRLAARYRVTAYDRPGHGCSGGGAREHALADNARVASALMGALALRDVVVVGHSYGGATALRLAVDNAPEASAFVLVGARAYGDISVEPIYRLVAVPWLGTGFARLAGALIAPRIIRKGISSSFAPNEAIIPKGFIEERVALWSQPKVAVAAALERVTFQQGLVEMAHRYREIAKPVFIVVGDHDARPLAAAPRLTREIRGARLVQLENTGHYVQYARPEELSRVIDEAVRGEPADR